MPRKVMRLLGKAKKLLGKVTRLLGKARWLGKGKVIRLLRKVISSARKAGFREVSDTVLITGGSTRI